MKIKEIKEQDLLQFCTMILTKTLIELNQNKDANWLEIFANSLKNDLINDFENLDIRDVELSFHNGIRKQKEKTEIIVLNVPTYYTWLTDHRNLKWSNESKEPERRDKRLSYRSRNGTGLTSISNKIKLLK